RTGGGAGGPDSWTGRMDRERFEAQIWNDPAQNRLPREALVARDEARRSPESLMRTPAPGFDDRAEHGPRAREGSTTPAPGGTAGASPGAMTRHAPRNWDEADPVFDG